MEIYKKTISKIERMKKTENSDNSKGPEEAFKRDERAVQEGKDL
jgi:hypothetical protein